MVGTGLHVAGASSTTSYDINTLAGKVASVNATPGLFFGMSGFIEQEANSTEPVATSTDPITPTYVPNSNLDGTTILAPDVTVNQDTAGAPQNEPAIAVDPNDANRIVVGSNDYVTGSWTCFIGSTPCSAIGDGYSGTYYSNNGGQNWCCASTDPSHLGTLIPGVIAPPSGLGGQTGDATPGGFGPSVCGQPKFAPAIAWLTSSHVSCPTSLT